MMLGNQLCISLLIDAKAALSDADWHSVLASLHEVEGHIRRHLQSEAEILYPRFAILVPTREYALMPLRQQHRAIGVELREALDSAYVRDAGRCNMAVSALIEMLSGHRLAQEPILHAVAHEAGGKMQESLATELWQVLRLPDQDAISCVSPAIHEKGRLH